MSRSSRLIRGVHMSIMLFLPTDTQSRFRGDTSGSGSAVGIPTSIPISIIMALRSWNTGGQDQLSHVYR